MTTADFERIKKEFGKLSYWEQMLGLIRQIRKHPERWSVKFHNTFSDEDIALPCAITPEMLERTEEHITAEYEKQKSICDSIKLPCEQENP